MANIEQKKKIIPVITREIPFDQNVCELVFGVNIFDLDLGFQVDSVKQPIWSNSVGSGHMPHRGTSAFDNHLDHGLVVLKDIQHSIRTRIRCNWMECGQC